MRRRGMTLVELVAVVVVLAIMLGVTIPMYTRAIERSRRRTARDILQTIYEGERAYYYTQPQDSRHYSTSWDAIFMDNPRSESIPVDYSFSNVTGTGSLATFIATATRRNSSPPQTMTINEREEWCGGSTPADDSFCNTSSFWPIP